MRSTRTLSWAGLGLGAVALQSAGCAGDTDALLPSPARFVEADEVEDFEVLESIGAVPARAPVRAVNRFGAAVRGEPTTALRVEGTPVEVAFDGFGYGALELAQPGSFAVEGGARPATVHAVDSAWPGVGLHPAWPAPAADPDPVVALSRGGVGAVGAELFWAGDGAPPHRVLEADGPLLGLRAAHVDVDGELDAIAWSASTVFLLRGRPGGGLGWGAALTATGLSPAAADAGDLSGDNLPDLAIAWVAQDGSGVVDVWEGDGLFGFEAAEPRNTSGRPTSLVIGDATDDGLAQVTVLLDSGEWTRFVQAAEKRFIPIGPLTPSSVLLPRDARLIPAGDINHDGADEIAIAAERVPGERRRLWFFDVHTDVQGCLDGDPAAQCSTEYLPLEDEPGAFVAVGDGNGDRLDDIWLLHDDRSVYAVAWDPEQTDGRYAKLEVFEAPAYGGIGLEDVDRDGSLDLFLAGGPSWWRWYGDAKGDVEEYWAPRPFETPLVREGVQAFALAELAGDDATVEAVVVVFEGGATRLKIVQYTPSGGRAPQLGDLLVSDGTVAPDDLAVCGEDAWLVIGGELLRVSLSQPTAPALAQRAGTDASRVDCGAAPEGAAAALLEAGEIRLLNRNLVELGAVPAPGARDVAIGDLGDGPEVRTCDTEGCGIVFLGGAAPRFAIGDPASLSLESADGQRAPLDGAGRPSVADLDADGNPDLLALAEPGPITLHRGTAGGLGPAEQLHDPRGFVGALAARDGDGDGWPDLWALDPEGSLVHTRAPRAAAGTPTDPGTPTDTGTPADTGASP